VLISYFELKTNCLFHILGFGIKCINLIVLYLLQHGSIVVDCESDDEDEEWGKEKGA
jgi:hypothetical protein